MTGSQDPAVAADDGIPVGRTVLVGLLLRRFGLLPVLALVLAGRRVPPARRRTVLTVAAGVYLGALAALLLLVVLLVGGLAFVVLSG